MANIIVLNIHNYNTTNLKNLKQKFNIMIENF